MAADAFAGTAADACTAGPATLQCGRPHLHRSYGRRQQHSTDRCGADVPRDNIYCRICGTFRDRRCASVFDGERLGRKGARRKDNGLFLLHADNMCCRADCLRVCVLQTDIVSAGCK